MSAPQVSVIICSYNRAAYIPLALQSLTEQTADATVFETIIVDNNSRDNTAEVCAAFISSHPGHSITYLTEKQQGSSFARNTGAAIAKGNWLVFMDDDAVANKDYIENIIRFFNNHPQANAMGGRIIPRYIPEKPKWISHHVASLVGNFEYSDTVVEFAAERYPLESNMVVAKKDFDAVKGFSTEIPGVQGTLRIGGEGKDFFLRLKATGKTVYYCPDVIVEHIVEVIKLTQEYLYRVGSGVGRGERVRVLQKGKWTYYKKVLEYIYKLGGSVVLGCTYVLKGHPSQFWPVIQYRIDALKGLVGK
jgi:glycosyltransferase involved in cell wall biosynthesis